MTKQTLEQLLDELHNETAKQLLKAIRAGDAAPGVYAAAIRFLKDNGVSGVPTKGSPIADLAEMVPFPTGAEDFAH